MKEQPAGIGTFIGIGWIIISGANSQPRPISQQEFATQQAILAALAMIGSLLYMKKEIMEG